MIKFNTFRANIIQDIFIAHRFSIREVYYMYIHTISSMCTFQSSLYQQLHQYIIVHSVLNRRAHAAWSCIDFIATIIELADYKQGWLDTPIYLIHYKTPKNSVNVRFCVLFIPQLWSLSDSLQIKNLLYKSQLVGYKNGQISIFSLDSHNWTLPKLFTLEFI